MYRLSRPSINLRSRNKIKFKQKRRILEGILKSPMNRGITLWNMIPENIQRAVTKVKFKAGLKGIVL